MRFSLGVMLRGQADTGVIQGVVVGGLDILTEDFRMGRDSCDATVALRRAALGCVAKCLFLRLKLIHLRLKFSPVS